MDSINNFKGVDIAAWDAERNQKKREERIEQENIPDPTMKIK